MKCIKRLLWGDERDRRLVRVEHRKRWEDSGPKYQQRYERTWAPSLISSPVHAAMQDARNRRAAQMQAAMGQYNYNQGGFGGPVYGAGLGSVLGGYSI
jgi:hypothetical protein